MLLTRSPLSPVPKDRFSLDLHVLSAPPAFVLSQPLCFPQMPDQVSTLEERSLLSFQRPVLIALTA